MMLLSLIGLLCSTLLTTSGFEFEKGLEKVVSVVETPPQTGEVGEEMLNCIGHLMCNSTTGNSEHPEFDKCMDLYREYSEVSKWIVKWGWGEPFERDVSTSTIDDFSKWICDRTKEEEKKIRDSLAVKWFQFQASGCGGMDGRDMCMDFETVSKCSMDYTTKMIATGRC